MIDIHREEILTLADAAERFPSSRQGKPTHYGTVVRYITRGIPCRNGERVKLEAARLGGRWYTSAEAIQRFADNLTEASMPSSEASKLREIVKPKRLPAERRRAIDQANQILDAAGF